MIHRHASNKNKYNTKNKKIIINSDILHINRVIKINPKLIDLFY